MNRSHAGHSAAGSKAARVILDSRAAGSCGRSVMVRRLRMPFAQFRTSASVSNAAALVMIEGSDRAHFTAAAIDRADSAPWANQTSALAGSSVPAISRKIARPMYFASRSASRASLSSIHTRPS